MFSSISKMFKVLREQQGISQDDLADGFVSRSTISRIERGVHMPSRVVIEHCLSKLGATINDYYLYSVDDMEYKTYLLREELSNYIGKGLYDRALTLVNSMEAQAAFKKGLHRQFLLQHKATIYWEKDADYAMELLKEAIAITHKSFSNELVSVRIISATDVRIINSIAVLHHLTGETDRAIAIAESLVARVKEQYINLTEKTRVLCLVNYNLSKFYGAKDRHEDALAVCNEAIDAGHATRVYGMLPELTYNKAYALHSLNQKEKVAPLIYDAYYGARLFGLDGLAELIKRNSLKNFNININ